MPNQRSDLATYFGKDKLNLGSGLSPEPIEDGWVNADFNPKASPQAWFDFRTQWPLDDDSFDTVLSSHTLEHFTGEQLFTIMWNIGRVLRPGGYLIGVVPYARSDNFVGNPFHKFGWTENTPKQFDRRLYEDPGTASNGADQMEPLFAWDVEKVMLTPVDGWDKLDDTQLRYAAKHYWNVIAEMTFVMKVVK